MHITGLVHGPQLYVKLCGLDKSLVAHCSLCVCLIKSLLFLGGVDSTEVQVQTELRLGAEFEEF